MSNAIFAVYGVSGFGREIMPLAREDLVARGVPLEQLYFIDDYSSATGMNGHLIVTYESFLQIPAARRTVALAIADAEVRSRLAARCEADGIAMWSIRASNVVCLDEVEIAHGAILAPFVTLTSNIRIGRHFHANIYSYVAHDCRIGDFVTFAPGVKCNGNVVIEDFAYIGAGAVIKQGKPGKPIIVGQGATVGMGAVVTRDVAPGTIVVGNPAQPMARA